MYLYKYKTIRPWRLTVSQGALQGVLPEAVDSCPLCEGAFAIHMVQHRADNSDVTVAPRVQSGYLDQLIFYRAPIAGKRIDMVWQCHVRMPQ